MDNLVTVKTFDNRIEAELAKGLLESNGIKSLILADDAGGVRPFPFSYSPSGVRLQVNKKDLAKAKQILES